MTETIELKPVDKVEITTLYENLIDPWPLAQDMVRRLHATENNRVTSQLLAEEHRVSFVGGHGLSMLVKVTRDGITRGILFDAGGSVDGLMHNLDCLEIDPRQWNCVVLSHGHWDHTNGLIGLHKRLGRLAMPLTLHPGAYLKRATKDQQGKMSRLNGTLSQQGLRDAGVELIETQEPSFVIEGMALVTGEVERTNDFETGWPEHYAERNGKFEPDPLICDDQGLVVNVRGKGLVVLSGCGHSGIVNMVNYARSITGIEKVHAVIGGYHLGPTFFRDRTSKVIDALVAMDPDIIYPAHCTGYTATDAIFHALPGAFVQNAVGTRITSEAEDTKAE
ncbi:MAG: MBL fold metallo-hydrolase [Dehalococcoidia bacterium]